MDPYDIKSHLEFVNMFTHDDELSIEENIRLSKFAILIINVKDSEERREKIIQNIKPLNLNTCIFNAVDGRKIVLHDTFNPLVRIMEYNNHYFLVDYTRQYDHIIRGDLCTGMIGASLSHQLIYNLIQFDSVYDNFLILEDDAKLLLDINTTKKYLANLPREYDMAYLNSESKWYPVEISTPINEYYNNVLRRHFNASVSYIISKQGAAKLLAYVRHDITRAPDDLLSNPHTIGLYTVIGTNKFLFGCDYSFQSDTERYSITPD